MHVRTIAVVALTTLWGCYGDTRTGEDVADADAAAADADATGTLPSGAVTWHGAARAVFAARCVTCHRTGGIGPFSFEDYDAAQFYAPAGLEAIEEGRMPPWPPDDGCEPLLGARRILPDEVALIAGWVEGGSLEGDPADYVPPVAAPGVRESAGAPDLSLVPPLPYTPVPERDDDYHCFVIEDPRFATEAWVQLLDVRPGRTDSVHHVLVYAVDPENVADARAADASTPEPGYTCFGGPGVSASMIGGWAPGAQPFRYQDGDAVIIPAGGLLVMQVHYNLHASADPDPGTAIDLWFADTPPSTRVLFLGLAHTGIKIQPGDANSVQTKVFDNPLGVPLQLMGTTPHMHMLGKSIRVRAAVGTGAERCLVDIPDWEFHWQQHYYYEKPVLLGPLDSVTVECTYDNSAKNQPEIHGVQQAPKLVRWGEGTLDEMCLNYLIVRTPYSPPGAGADGTCTSFDACYQSCRDGDKGLSYCTISCALTDSACAGCLTQGIGACLAPTCPSEIAALFDCVEGCTTAGGNIGVCLFTQCTAPGDTLDLCAEALTDAGACDGALAVCAAHLARPEP